ncbi:MAG: thioredoxin family protein [Planctomycetes bacterium]|nr:thioredoxin family protein [Planctomycetota bacterium]
MKTVTSILACCLALPLFTLSCAGTNQASTDATPAQTHSKVNADGASAAIPASFYTVDHYDEARDASADLRATIARAQIEHKRILLQVGGDWCHWCKQMSHFLETNPAVRAAVEDNFVLMKVTWTMEHKNEAFLSQYPQVEAFPHLFVLESDGTFLHSQGTSELEQGDGYNEAVYLKFLRAWAPSK